MLDLSVQIETKIAELRLTDLKKYWKENQPKFWVFLLTSGEVYRSEESRRDLDIIPAFRTLSSQEEYIERHDLEGQELWPLQYGFEEIVFQCTRQTLVALDPSWDEGLNYDDFFIIEFKSFRHKNP